MRGLVSSSKRRGDGRFGRTDTFSRQSVLQFDHVKSPRLLTAKGVMEG
jgi:hypothetical protein